MGIFQHLDPLARRRHIFFEPWLRETPVCGFGTVVSHDAQSKFCAYHRYRGYAMSFLEQREIGHVWFTHSFSPSCHQNLEREQMHLGGPATVGNQVAQCGYLKLFCDSQFRIEWLSIEKKSPGAPHQKKII